LLQGVFSALSGGAPAPVAAGTATAPQQQQQQAASPPHLLQSISDFLQQLGSVPASGGSSSSSEFGPMPVTSLAPGLPQAAPAGAPVNSKYVLCLCFAGVSLFMICWCYNF
jgi:hypothetical protein